MALNVERQARETLDRFRSRCAVNTALPVGQIIHHFGKPTPRDSLPLLSLTAAPEERPAAEFYFSDLFVVGVDHEIQRTSRFAEPWDMERCSNRVHRVCRLAGSLLSGRLALLRWHDQALLAKAVSTFQRVWNSDT
jgi:hypothetical protein